MKQIIGKKHFGSIIDITDPCYDKDVWCRINNVEIQEGTYDCAIKENKDNRVSEISICLEGFGPQDDLEELVGYIGVDAGLAGFFENKPDYADDEWYEFCSRIETGDAWIFDEGFFSNSGWGDGEYSVYGYREDGVIKALRIQFI